jgi:hypothetical protein
MIHLGALLMMASLMIPLSEYDGLPPLILNLIDTQRDQGRINVVTPIVIAQPDPSPNRKPSPAPENPPSQEPPDDEPRDAPQLTALLSEEERFGDDPSDQLSSLEEARQSFLLDSEPPRIARVLSITADDESPERRRMNEVVDQFILYDIGRLSEKAAARAKREFEQLGPEAIPSLVYGVNKAAYYGQSCPYIVISRKLCDELSRSNDPAMIAYALNNIGRGVADNAPHAARVRGLRQQLADELGRVEAVVTAKLQSRGLPADPDLVRLVGSIAKGSLSDLQVALRDDAPRVRLAAVIALELRSGMARPPNTKAGRLIAQALDDENQLIRDAAEEILNQLSDGANLGQNSKAWAEYWMAFERAERLKQAPLSQLLAALNNGDWRLRRAAASAVADSDRRLTDGQTVQLAKRLLDLLERDRAEVQHAAWQALLGLSPSGAPVADRPRDAESLCEEVRRWRAHWDQFEVQRVLEPRAGSYLSMARKLEPVGKKKPAAGRYRGVIEDFPGTSAAAEAHRRLLAIGSD